MLLTWTKPLETSDGERLKQLGTSRVCRSVKRELPRECVQLAGEVDGGAPGEQAAFVDRWPAELQSQDPGSDVTYSIETLNVGGRSAGMSQAVRVPRIAVAPPPDDLEARVTQEAIVLTWNFRPEQQRPDATTRTLYRVFRRSAGAEGDVRIAEVNSVDSSRAELRDPAIEWGQTYQYRVTPVMQIARPGQPPRELEGEDSKLLEVLAEDRFPPAVPAGVQAVFSSVPLPDAPRGFIDLTWSPPMDSDVAGYNVWRREDGEWRRLNPELVKTPAYRDKQLQPGTTEYSVSAVDLRGNESGRSTPASEEVPKP